MVRRILVHASKGRERQLIDGIVGIQQELPSCYLVHGVAPDGALLAMPTMVSS